MLSQPQPSLFPQQELPPQRKRRMMIQRQELFPHPQEDPLSQDVLQFVADRRISLSKMEQIEPTLETLFMEAVEK